MIDGTPTSLDHFGIDVANTEGTPVHAAEWGRVVNIRASNVYGTQVSILHPDGRTTRYNHLEASSVLVTPSEIITAGRNIAAIGSTGRVTGPHLDFEVLDDNRLFIDPLSILPPIPPDVALGRFVIQDPVSLQLSNPLPDSSPEPPSPGVVRNAARKEE